MSNRLSSMAPLRIFEAAARHLNFSEAGREVGLTPAAVSSQIRVLERQLGATLFRRSSRSMRLTRQGVMFLGAASEAILLIDEAAARIAATAGSATLTVTTTPSFAAKWLVPRLQHFRQARPDIDLRIDVSDSTVDLARGDADVGIRFGNGAYPGMRCDRLFGEAVFPVCAPSLLTGERPLRRPQDLRHHTLVHLAWDAQGDAWPDWRTWLLAAGVDGVDHGRGLHFSQTSLVLQAAVDGQGVALGNTSLVGDDIAAGRLVRPFTLALEIAPTFAYYLIAPARAANRPVVKAFRDWIFGEIAEISADPPTI
jgi:LysR family transcriptional regulator, glycine cleavage system transcriptional activator